FFILLFLFYSSNFLQFQYIPYFSYSIFSFQPFQEQRHQKLSHLLLYKQNHQMKEQEQMQLVIRQLLERKDEVDLLIVYYVMMMKIAVSEFHFIYSFSFYINLLISSQFSTLLIVSFILGQTMNYLQCFIIEQYFQEFVLIIYQFSFLFYQKIIQQQNFHFFYSFYFYSLQFYSPSY
ncbi:MAG: hypothetical protein EZS28_018217, partial [Streblomastix strix]